MERINKIIRLYLQATAAYLLLPILFTPSLIIYSSDSKAVEQQVTKDPHRAESGFFDIHICNWPDRPPFYLALFGTEEYDEIASIEVIAPDNSKVGELDLSKFNITQKTKTKSERHVFLTQLKPHKNKLDGWYLAKINFKNKASQTAQDFIIHQTLGRAGAHSPAHETEDIKLPQKLSWDIVKGAAFYKVFIRDMWAGNKLIYSSDLLTTNTLDVPEGLLKSGGYYAWRVHSRDLNEHVQLGDFNTGSLSQWFEFSIVD